MNVAELVRTKDVQVVIPGTFEGNFYKVAYANDKGCVGVKKDNYLGSDDEVRVRCILWSVQNGIETGGDYFFLLDKGWEEKKDNHHTSIYICNMDDETDYKSEVEKRIEEAIVFLNM
jgi:hypothetical protein